MTTYYKSNSLDDLINNTNTLHPQYTYKHYVYDTDISKLGVSDNNLDHSKKDTEKYFSLQTPSVDYCMDDDDIFTYQIKHIFENGDLSAYKCERGIIEQTGVETQPTYDTVSLEIVYNHDSALAYSSGSYFDNWSNADLTKRQPLCNNDDQSSSISNCIKYSDEVEKKFTFK